MAGAMTKVSVRNIGAHKLRLALTVLAVVLGTAFISGSLMFTNMLERTFDSAVASRYDDIDVVVQPAEGKSVVPAELREELKADPQVARVAVDGSEAVVVADADANAIQTGAGESRVSLYYPADAAVGEPIQIAEGAEPTKPGEVLLNAAGAEKYGISVGEKIIVVDPEARHEMTVTGLYSDELDRGASLMLKVPESAFLEFYTNGRYVPGLVLEAADGITPAQLKDHLVAEHDDVSVKEGVVAAEDMSKQIRQGLSFISYFLTAFGLVGLLVGTFLIANTFSMIVAQRTKEFALLRALGASKGQITRSVVMESLLVGLLGSVLGVVAGAGLVAVIRAVMEAQGMGLSGVGSGLSVSAVAVPIVVGVIVTVLSAWAPARRAGRVQPVEAMRSSETATPQPLIARTVFGGLLLAAGAGFLAWGVMWDDGSTSRRAVLIGAAAVCVIVGLFLAGPALSLPIVPVLGRIIGAPFGSMGSLAATNSKRNPRRSSATAFALMLGIALVTAIGMLGSTMERSVDDVLENEVDADMVLQGPQLGTFPIPNDLPERVKEVDGSGEVVSYTQARVTVNGEFGKQFGPIGATDVISGDPGELVTLNMTQGSSSLIDGGVLLPTSLAAEKGVEVGDKVTIAAPGWESAPEAEATVTGLFEDSNIFASWVLSQKTVEQILPPENLKVLMVGVNGDGSVSVDELRANLEAAVHDDIVVQVRSPEDLGGEAQQMINQMLYVLYALLSLAVVIAILGIINTLTLSVIERRQEIGMLRAVGTQRGQVRTMIILESVQIAVFGALLGVATGLLLGWAFLKVMADQGLENIAYPWTMIGVMLVGSVLVGIIAALWPAQRAAKTPPLDAIAE
ncbi:ABC transporter permease [uncultured Corynebacterium sp.]|uniref:ABC transporter permease n=1 Tax=uncultured Corynebacterium sp. TaxID=159447 RepID=UPI00262006CE|nr:FtsX-like permease family protein [uncultured Corynebacterium sp.]